jgi:U3 small nucleolar RNA-associated protein 10
MDDALVPLLGQVAVTMGDDATWKALNHKVLLKTRSPHMAVRTDRARVQFCLCVCVSVR